MSRARDVRADWRQCIMARASQGKHAQSDESQSREREYQCLFSSSAWLCLSLPSLQLLLSPASAGTRSVAQLVRFAASNSKQVVSRRTMAASASVRADRRSNEPIYPDKPKVPRTPLESRQGYHPKKVRTAPPPLLRGVPGESKQGVGERRCVNTHNMWCTERGRFRGRETGSGGV